MPRRLAAAFALVISSGVFAQVRFESEEEHWRAAASDFLNLSDRNVALDKFHSFIMRYEDSDRAAGAQFMIGECYMAAGRYGAARLAYEKARGMRGGESDYFKASVELRIGETYFNEGRFEKAWECFNRVVDKFARTWLTAEAIYDQVRTIVAEERWTEFEQLFDRLVGEYPGYAEHPRSRFTLAFFKYMGGDYDGALPLFEALDTDVAMFFTGRTLEHLGRFIPATSKYRLIAARHPESELLDEAAFEVGEAYYKAGQYSVAIQAYEDMIAVHGASPTVHFARYKIGACQYYLRRFDDAIATFEAVVAGRPPQNLAALAQYMVGNCYLDQGKMSEAVYAYAATIQYEDSTDISASSQYKIAYAYAERGVYDNAIVQAQRFLTSFPGHPLEGRARLVLAASCLMWDRPDEAQAELSLIMDRFPGTEIFEKALYLSSASYYESAQYDRVVTNYNFISKNMPPSDSEWRGRTYYYIGECYYKMGQYENAARFYERVLDGYATSDFVPLAFEGMVAAYSSMGNFDLAHQKQQEYLRRLSAEGRGTTPSAFVLASIYYNQKDYESAIRLLEKFVAQNPDSPQLPRALDKLAWSLYRARYYEESVGRWQEVVSRHPDSPEAPRALYQIGDTQFGLGKFEEAQATFARFVEQYSATEDSLTKRALLSIGNCYANMGQTESAIAAFERVVNSYPKDPVAQAAMQAIQTVYYRSGRSLDEFVKRYPLSELAAQALWQLGAKAIQDSNYHEAVAYLQRVMRDFPGSAVAPQAMYWLAEAYRLRGDLAQAVVTYQNFIATYPEDNNATPARFQLGITQNKAGDYLGSAQTFEVIAANTADTIYAPTAIWYACVNYGKIKKWDRLIETYNRLLELFPEHPNRDDALLGIGWTYQNELLTFPEAIVAYEKVISSNPPASPEVKVQAQWHIAECYMAQRDTTTALAEFEKLRAMGPASDNNRLQGLIALAELYQGMARWAEARQVYADIMAVTADKPDVQAWIQQKLTWIEQQIQAGG